MGIHRMRRGDGKKERTGFQPCARIENRSRHEPQQGKGTIVRRTARHPQMVHRRARTRGRPGRECSLYRHPPLVPRHIRHHGHESRQTSLCGKAVSCQLRGMRAHQPSVATDGSALLRGLLPPLLALLPQSEGTPRARQNRQSAQCANPFCRTPKGFGLQQP